MEIKNNDKYKIKYLLLHNKSSIYNQNLYCYISQVFIKYFLYCPQMQNSQSQDQSDNFTPRDIIAELKNVHQKVLGQQRHQLNELLNLQKLLNQIQSTSVTKRQQQQKIKASKQVKQQKKEFNVQRIGQKIDELIDQTEEIIVVENMSDNKRAPVLSLLKGKKELNNTKSELVAEKKAPVPVVNRSRDASSRGTNATRYIPPRNKNEVTGKVTQTRVSTQQKVFRAQVTAKVGNHPTNPPLRTTNHLTQKRPPLQPNNLPTITTSLPQHLQPDNNSISQYKNLRATTRTNKLKQFSKSIQELAQQIQGKKQSTGKRVNVKQMVQKYVSQEMGHKAMEEKRRRQFIKKFNHFSFSQNRSNCNEITTSSPKRLWKQYPQIFQFNHLIQTFEEEVHKIQQQIKADFKVDPKQAYRLQVKRQLLGLQIDKIRQSTQIQVPQKLQLTFKPVPQKKTRINSTSSQENVSLVPLYKKLRLFLQSIQLNQNLSTKHLSSLRVLSSISLYDGKRSPLIVESAQLMHWKDFYDQVDDAHQQQQQQSQ